MHHQYQHWWLLSLSVILFYSGSMIHRSLTLFGWKATMWSSLPALWFYSKICKLKWTWSITRSFAPWVLTSLSISCTLFWHITCHRNTLITMDLFLNVTLFTPNSPPINMTPELNLKCLELLGTAQGFDSCSENH